MEIKRGIIKEDGITVGKWKLLSEEESIKEGTACIPEYRKTVKGEEVEVTVYSEVNECLGIPYFDIITKDKYYCKVFSDLVEIIN
jgi:hypothetical protein